MSAQQEQTERATPAAAPAATKQYKKGVVKQVMDGGAVVIRGPPRNGPPPEMTLALTNIDAPRLARRKTANAEATEVRNVDWTVSVFTLRFIRTNRLPGKPASISVR